MAKKLHYEAEINAPAATVWDKMLGKETYSEWTAAFMPGGYYEGEWEAGSKMRFLGPSEDGKDGGMLSTIAEIRKPEFVSIHHIGIIEDGVEKTGDDVIKDWGDALENYTFSEKDGVTTVKVDMDSADEYADMFNKQWPEALAKLKEISERG